MQSDAWDRRYVSTYGSSSIAPRRAGTGETRDQRGEHRPPSRIRGSHPSEPPIHPGTERMLSLEPQSLVDRHARRELLAAIIHQPRRAPQRPYALIDEICLENEKSSQRMQGK